jgi:tetratricopeptide (TPR) repeat protein
VANPRIDELRKRLEREPGSRLFGQLAEELRKDGDLSEAIRVARAGLTAHPNYPSARMTLGRALFDTGDLAAARGELEHVLRGAPDNILASRMLAECLEGLGDLGAALLQFRAALRLAPGDRPTELQIKALEQRLGAPGGRPGPPPAPPQPPPPPSGAPAGQRRAGPPFLASLLRRPQGPRPTRG